MGKYKFVNFIFLSVNSQFPWSKLKFSTNSSVSWKMIPYSRPKLYDFYTLSQTYLLENHTLHSKFTAARIYCTACIWQPLGYAPGHTVAISRKHSPHGDFYKTPSTIFTMYLPPSPCGIWLIIAQSFGVLFSFPPSHLGGFSQVLGLFIKDAQTDLLTCFGWGARRSEG